MGRIVPDSRRTFLAGLSQGLFSGFTSPTGRLHGRPAIVFCVVLCITLCGASGHDAGNEDDTKQPTLSVSQLLERIAESRPVEPDPSSLFIEITASTGGTEGTRSYLGALERNGTETLLSIARPRPDGPRVRVGTPPLDSNQESPALQELAGIILTAEAPAVIINHNTKTALMYDGLPRGVLQMPTVEWIHDVLGHHSESVDVAEVADPVPAYKVRSAALTTIYPGRAAIATLWFSKDDLSLLSLQFVYRSPTSPSNSQSNVDVFQIRFLEKSAVPEGVRRSLEDMLMRTKRAAREYPSVRGRSANSAEQE